MDLVPIIEKVDGVERVNIIERGEYLEIELMTMWASRDNQPEVSFDVVTMVFAEIFGGVTQAKATNFVTGDSFAVHLVTYSADNEYPYESLTDYDTLVKLKDRQISYEGWVNTSNAHFR